MELFYLPVSISVFILGACIGSFLNVLIDRLPRQESIFLKRSHCDNCKKTLSSKELIPLFSFLFLKGKCRSCKSKIPKRLFWVEAISGLAFLTGLFLYLSARVDITALLFSLIIFSILLVIFFTDIEDGIIPDETIAGLIGVSFVWILFFKQNAFLNHFITGAILLLLFFSLFSITKRRGMGLGDVKFSFALGFFLGFPRVVAAVYLAFLTGAIASIILILWGKKKLRGDTIPFGPFLALATFITYLIGDQIIRVVLGIIG